MSINIFFPWLKSNAFQPKQFKQLLKQLNLSKYTKERQCLTLFRTEVVFSQKAVSDLHWKNIETKRLSKKSWDKKCPLKLRFLKVVDSVVSRAFSKIAWYVLLCIPDIIFIDIYLWPRILETIFILPELTGQVLHI